MLVSEIVALTKVLLEIIKLIYLLPSILDSVTMKMRIRPQIFPLTLPDPSTVEIKVVTPLLCLPKKQLSLINTINPTVIRSLKATETRKRRKKIYAGKNGVAGAISWHLPGPAHNTWEPVARLIGRPFAIPKWTSLSPENRALRMPLLALGIFVLIPWPIITGVYHERSLGEIQVIQNIE